MTVVFAVSDQAFAVPLAVLLRSIQESQPQPAELTVCIASLGISTRTIDEIRASAPALKLEFLDISDQLPAELPVISRLGRATWGRIFAADLLGRSHSRAL